MLKLYNSLTRQVETFKPINQREVKLYACGPTVYQFAHIGNFRSFITADLLVRALRQNKYDVNYVMNITDVGHLTNDDIGGADTGEDKIEKTASREGKTAREVADFYTEAFIKDAKSLNMVEPNTMPRATDHIFEQIELIEKLQKKGYTYLTNDGVYFDTSKFKNYGQLSSLDEIKAGARVEINSEKKNPRDFALWKFSYTHGTHRQAQGDTALQRQMEWDSPWGIGFPGWHLECSAMSMKYLGEQIDLHTGGIDHKEIHHPNEIAQSEGATGKKFVNYWLHTAFMLIAGQKMSKSLGNIYTIYDLEKQKFNPLALRYLYLQTHYRQEMNFTFAALDAAQNAYNNILKALARCGEPAGELPEYEQSFYKAINDDLNTPQALSVLWEIIKSDTAPEAKAGSIYKLDELLGLGLREAAAGITETKQIIPQEVQMLVKERLHLRKNRRFNDADRIRKQINLLGYSIEDNEKGTKVRKINS